MKLSISAKSPGGTKVFIMFCLVIFFTSFTIPLVISVSLIKNCETIEELKEWKEGKLTTLRTNKKHNITTKLIGKLSYETHRGVYLRLSRSITCGFQHVSCIAKMKPTL